VTIVASSQAAASTDFMSDGYGQIGLPLNLDRRGRQWFADICAPAVQDNDAPGLVLGAVSWMGQLLRRTRQRVCLADASTVMLDIARHTLGDPADAAIELANTDWLSLPRQDEPLGIVLGDNSFSFLPFPDGWLQLAGVLAERMRPGAYLVMRLLSAPADYLPDSPEVIAARYEGQRDVNLTEVRVALLFSQWDRGSYAIDTEQALRAFERHRPLFDPLMNHLSQGAANDLITLRKYRDTGAVYYAPPLEQVLRVLGVSFTVTSVHFGPYASSRNFPLIVATNTLP
jgi:hypothetical protein